VRFEPTMDCGLDVYRGDEWIGATVDYNGSRSSASLRRSRMPFGYS
jgi:hypothetical protein